MVFPKCSKSKDNHQKSCNSQFGKTPGIKIQECCTCFAVEGYALPGKSRNARYQELKNMITKKER